MASPMKGDRRKRFREDAPKPKPAPKKGKETKS